MAANAASTAVEHTKSPSVDAHMADHSSKELTPAPSRNTSVPASSNGDGLQQMDGAIRLKDTSRELDSRNSDDIEASRPHTAHVKMEHDK